MTQIIIDNVATNYMADKEGNIFNSKTNKCLKGTIRNGYRMVKLTVMEKLLMSTLA